MGVVSALHNDPSSSATLTPLDAALRLLLNGGPIEPIDVSVASFVGGIAAAIAPLQLVNPASRKVRYLV